MNRDVLTRANERNLTIRWLIGETSDFPMRGVGYDLLEMSIKFAKLIFPNAQRIIHISDLPLGLGRIKKISSLTDTPYTFVRELPNVPPSISYVRFGHGFWKYIPLRINRGGFDLIMENDLILWRIPSKLALWLYDGGLLCYGVDTGGTQNTSSRGDTARIGKITDEYLQERRKYGLYQNRIDKINDRVFINPGVVGFGFNCSSLPYDLKDLGMVTSPDDEAGWLTLNYLKYTGRKHLMATSSIAYVDNANFKSHNLVERYDGAHFLKHNSGEYRFYQEKYSRVIAELYEYYHYLSIEPQLNDVMVEPLADPEMEISSEEE